MHSWLLGVVCPGFELVGIHVANIHGCKWQDVTIIMWGEREHHLLGCCQGRPGSDRQAKARLARATSHILLRYSTAGCGTVQTPRSVQSSLPVVCMNIVCILEQHAKYAHALALKMM